MLINNQTSLPEILKEEFALVCHSCHKGVSTVDLREGTEDTTYAMYLEALDWNFPGV